MIISGHLEKLVTLFADGSSFGDDINYDHEFEFVKSEVGKLANIDYDMLEEKTFSLLTEKSKDIRLFSFLGLCYLKKGNWDNFCNVFDAMGKLIQKDYNSLFPIRPRAKQLAFKWMSEGRFVDAVENAKPPVEANEHIKRMASALSKIKEVLNDQFPNGSPFPSQLYSAVQKWEKSTEPVIEQQVTKPVQTKDEPTQNQNANGQTSAQKSQKISSIGESENPETPKEIVENIRKLALLLIDKEPKNSRGYRLMRIIRWGSVESAPAADGTTTRLEAPADQRRQFLQSLLGKGDFKAALDTVEKAFSSGPTHYWLDLQRISATAASQLGFMQVRDAIIQETALFIQRVPQIKALSFSNGTPFCDPATIDWLESDVESVFDSNSVSAGKNSGDQVEEDRREVNALVASNKIEQALELLDKKISETNSVKDNFRRKLVVSSVMLNAKRADIAMYLLESMDECINKYNLCLWDPQLSSDTLTLLVRAYTSALSGKQNDGAKLLMDKRDTVIRKLSCINPKAAYKLKN